MLLNSRRERVADCGDPSQAACPLCGGRLVAKRPGTGLWHWAHYPQPHDHEKCPHTESWWHLKMKLATMLLGPEWSVEVPLDTPFGRYVVDAVHTDPADAAAGKGPGVVEYVHTLTPYYMKKYRDLALCNYRISYILDGEQFISRRVRPDRVVGGWRMFLKPKARGFADAMLTGRNGWACPVQTHVHAETEDWLSCRLPAGMARKATLQELDRRWLIDQPEPGWLNTVVAGYGEVDLDDHRNNPEEIRERVRKVAVKRLVDWI